MRSVLQHIIGSVLRISITWLGRRRLPKVNGILSITGLSAPTEVIRDQWGIPHIYANNNHDLLFAQGFIHAQDRLWQMEFNRRIAGGRLSEVFGDIALDTDRATRTLGFNRLAKVDWDMADNEIKSVVQAYIKGINAFLEHSAKKLPIEFTLLKHKPEPWKPEDVLAFARLFVWQLSEGWYGEIIRSWLIKAVGEEHAAELEIHYPEQNPATLPKGIEFNRLGGDGILHAEKGPFLKRSMGSNSWVVSGHKTVTGKPFLCNDMHLSILLPSIWYEMHLITDHVNVIGASLPGIPMVMVGHNTHIAWGCTLAFTDCEDLFVEKFHPEQLHRYQFKDQWLQAEVLPEVIYIKGQDKSHIEKVVITQHGPIISDTINYTEQHIAVNSFALRPCQVLKAWWLLNQANNWDEFVEAMRFIEAPPLNVTYADTDGNIGYWVTGKVPVRAKGNGKIPVPGWTGEYEWIGEVPFEEMPHAFNPEQNYLVTCNNRIIPDDYPHFLGNNWMNGYRARRITDLLENKPKMSIDDFRHMQMDVTCLPGLEFVSLLEGLKSRDSDIQNALDYLRSWDGQLNPNSIPGLIYEVTRYTLVRNIFEQGLGEELTTRIMGQSFHPVLKSSHEFYGQDTVTVFRMLKNPNSWWIIRAGGRQAVLEKSLKQATTWLRNELGGNKNNWRWGKIHKVIFPHAMSLRKPLDKVFNRGPFPIGGDTDTPLQTATSPDDPYDNKAWTPTYRQIVDMGDFSRSFSIHAPGQSGQLGSCHYDDFVNLWIKGEYHPVLWIREEIERQAKAKLILNP